MAPKIGVLDFETDPFDNKIMCEVLPFLGVIYFSDTDYKVFQNETSSLLMQEILTYLDSLDYPVLLYAHNGGRFDYKLMVAYIRGKVMVNNGRLMKFKRGIHEFRDSIDLLRVPLCDIQKDAFDYHKMTRENRQKWMAEITRYCIGDCRYLHKAIISLRAVWGNVLTIGSAALKAIRADYPDICGMTEVMDETLRPFFRGGRVECVEGAGIFKGKFQNWDFNSSYPNVMASFSHPIGKNYFDYPYRETGGITDKTAFVDLSCASDGAFLYRAEGNPANGVLLSTPRDDIVRRYKVSIHELRVALKYDLVHKVTYHGFYDCTKWTTFEKYIKAHYAARIITKKLLETIPHGSQEHFEVKIQDTMLKLLLNNSFGKLAQDPRNFHEYLFCDRNAPHPGEELGWEIDTVYFEKNEIYIPNGLIIYRRPEAFRRYNNVATAASITGAARANLLEALQFAIRPIYSDTDSIICEGFKEHILVNGALHKFPFSFDASELGALKLEWQADEVGIAGKKLYYAIGKGKPLIKAKGVNGEDISLDNLRDLINLDKPFTNVSKGPALGLDGSQKYITRTIKCTTHRSNMI